MEDTEANNKGNNEAKVKSRLNTSTAKTNPASGDLKTAEIAPAAAQPINKNRVLVSNLNNELILELKVEPEPTAGPRSPTEPPKPTVIGDNKSGKYPLNDFIFPSFLEREYKIKGIADFTSFLIINLVIKYTIRSPITGMTK